MSGFQRHFDLGAPLHKNPFHLEALAAATTIERLIELGVERAITLWPEWIVAFLSLDKLLENRPKPPPKNLVGKRVAFHAGAHVGGQPSNASHTRGLYALIETAKAAGWCVELKYTSGLNGTAWIELRKGDVLVRLDGRYNPAEPLGPGNRPACEGAVGIARSAIMFTAVITGHSPPTAKPDKPWQFASTPEAKSCAWHLEDIIPVARPILGAGVQGFWPLSRLLGAG